ncbi:MAG: hypothetical protein ACRDGD_03760 [Candidatus Limnocylindria bacterium]
MNGDHDSAALVKRELNTQLPGHCAMVDIGGLWWARPPVDRSRLVSESRRRGVRALELHESDIGLVRELPELEFLSLIDLEDPEPLYALPNLRGLSISGTWQGRIDFRQLPRLESFGVVECPRPECGLETLYEGHLRLRRLDMGHYRHADLRPLARLRLDRLSIGYARILTSLDGADALAKTVTGLALFNCPKLASLDGVEALTRLEALSVERLRQITTLDFVRRLPRLRHLDVFDLENVETLSPIADHPSLEFVAFGRIRDLDLDPLTRLPRLKMILTGSYRWNRDVHAFPYLHDFPVDHPLVAEWRALQAS